ncbi:hypothetical protein ACKFKG_19775 [Phormidesmis sp. 146-35]
MSAVLRPVDRQNRSLRVAASPRMAPAAQPQDLRRARMRVAPPADQSTVRRLPSLNAPPKWVRSLIKLQQASLITTFAVSGLALVTYIWTVDSQQLWGKEYQKLEELRRSERQLGANSALLQNHIANQANSPGATLVPRTPDGMIFLKPAPLRNAPPENAPTPQVSPVAPLGY